jgi:predicted ATPase/class 3 adenylate cyclase
MNVTVPSGVVTFLFTDIEGSTRRWEADADAMRSALESHDAVLRESIEKYDGRLFKHTGDGVCAVFASPRAAVDAAVSAQRALELPVRMGISTGEAELRGDDYFGAVLNRAARVMAAGHGGQILVDGATAGLLTGTDLMPLGTRRLRDIANPIEIFQVNAAGLSAEFPALKTADPTPGNLKPPNSSLIGREREIAELEQALKGHRLVTLTGVGGVGKTRLSLEVAARVAEQFADGVWVIELATVGDPEAVPEAVAAVFGVTQQPGLSVAESVAAALEGRSRLLVFDNCEHVLDAAAAMIETIFARSSTVTILATSREGLRIATEQRWPVPTLDVTTGAASAAVMLFTERASAVAPDHALTAAELDVVADICRRLDGIPLAIELASSRLHSMTVTDVRDRLDDRFRLLVGSRRGLERHQTLRHAVQWSFDLLDEAEKEMLTRCSVFAGGFDLKAACAVNGLDDEFGGLDLLDALTRKSLLVADRSTAHTRFSILETIRQFAEEQLVAGGQADAARSAHARFFAAAEAELMSTWDSPQQREAYSLFITEFANLRTAFRWAADTGDIDSAAAVASYAAFIGYWVAQYEPIGWAEELIEPALAQHHRRLAQLYVLSAHCFVTGRVDDATSYIEASQSLSPTDEYDPVPYDLEAWFGGAYIAQGRPELWVELCRNIINRDRQAHIVARSFLVLALNIVGPEDRMRSAAEGLFAIAENTENPQVLCTALLACGIAARSTDPQMARELLLHGLQIAGDTGNQLMKEHLTTALSRLTSSHGEPLEACDHLARTIRNFCDSGSFSLMYSPLAILAELLDRLGRVEAAAVLSGFAATPWTHAANTELDVAIKHLRHALGDARFESLARDGAGMSNAEMAAYALDQIDIASAQLQADH